MADQTDPKKWGNRVEAAEILDVSVNTLDRWLATGQIDIRRLGQRLSLDDVRRLRELGGEDYMRERYRNTRGRKPRT